ncbi:MAX dimerization protein MGA a [Xenentodon cancila]
MASTKTQQGMVILKEGAPALAAAPGANHPPGPLVPLRPGRVRTPGIDPHTCIPSKETDFRTKEAMMKTGGLKHPNSLKTASDNLSPDSICKGVTVTLDNNSMWREFFSCRTEMMVTKEGSRMFPYCRFHISGLQPSKKYSLLMDIQPLDSSQYRWTGESWEVSRKGEAHIKSRPFAHPESPAAGQHWMQSPVSFYRLKLTNNISDQEGNSVLHLMHRYLPRLHVVQTDKAAENIRLNGPGVLTFTFPQTEFIAVTAYQNPQLAQLKINYNPFAKGLNDSGSSLRGLKLTPNSRKDLNKDGGNATAEQHPVKQNLKSLIANHKPRCSKAGTSKPTVPEPLQKSSSTNNDWPATKVPGESLRRNSRPSQKLFSELIREAHVSLQRCSVEQLGASQDNDETEDLSGGKERAVDSVKAPARKSQTAEMKRPFNSCDDKGSVGTGGPSSSSQDYSEHLDQPGNLDLPPDAVKQHKRPARVPLPALALFLKQHSAKCKKTNSKPDSAPIAPLSASKSSSAASDQTAINKPVNQDSGWVRTDFQSDEMELKVIGQTAQQSSGPSCPSASPGSGPDPEVVNTDDPLPSDSECSRSEPAVPDGTPVLPNTVDQFSNVRMSTSTLSTCATSSMSSSSPPLLSTVLPALNPSQNPAGSSTLPSDSRNLKTESLLPDPECSSLDFEPLSPASSPEPLPPLPASLASELDSIPSDSVCAAGQPEDLPHCKNLSVFQWHTVLPPSEPYVNTNFSTFQSMPPAPSLVPVTSPLLPCQSEPHSLKTSTSTPSSDASMSFQESEQLLPFPAELSPLTLQLPLSPTFSSLNGDELSPTPSLSDLVHFFSNDGDAGIGVAFPNTEAAVVPCPFPTAEEVHKPPPQEQPVSASKPCKRKKTKFTKFARLDVDQRMEDYRSLQPNLEEVEEQLFISFTSKEALKLHIADAPEELAPEITTKTHSAAEGNDSSNGENLEEMFAVFQKSLLRDLKLMKYRQVIHPVLQEVGLKMSLLDPALSIDLQYLGVHLPIPPPGVHLETLNRTLPSSQGVSAVFMSRTGKTTDVTQIKGWREKFTLPEAPPTPAASTPEAGPSSDVQKKNLSAFCSDMLDEYLENEGKLINERAASFSQPPVETPAYELPMKSTSYVRTLDHVLMKQTSGSPATDLISGFIPPSKRPRLKETKIGRRAKNKGPKQNKPRPESAAAPGSESGPAAALLQTSERSHKPTFKRRRKLKPQTSSQTLTLARTVGMSDDLAPLESDSELGQDVETCRRPSRPVITRALLRQRDLEDGVVGEGRYRTSITEERAAIALSSLFTLTGFVRENPTAPIQVGRRRAAPCLNEFCRLGCICSSLSHSFRNGHCGRPPCMFGCSCLKQKVVLLKNLDSPDTSPSSQHGSVRKRRRRRRRMRMAYVLKEADSVSQPAERIRTLWRLDEGVSDPEPVHIPAMSQPFRPSRLSRPSRPSVGRQIRSSCARVRGFRRKMDKQKKPGDQMKHDDINQAVVQTHDWKEVPEDVKLARDKTALLKFQKRKKKNADTPNPHHSALMTNLSVVAREEVQPPPSPPIPSKRLFIMAGCKWSRDSDQNYVLKKLCEAMAQDQLDKPFWIRNYLISPQGQTVQGSGEDQCLQYRIRISRPSLERQKPPAAGNLAKQRGQRAVRPTAQHRQKDHRTQVTRGAEPPEDWQREVVEEVEPPEDWQKEVEEGDIEAEMERCTGYQMDMGQENSREMKSEQRRRLLMALPFLTGVSPAGFLSANKKQPEGPDHLVQVNGKHYPLAKIQLGKMGALHPANRLAAYLTGRVAPRRQQVPPTSSSSTSSCKPLTIETVSVAPSSAALTAPVAPVALVTCSTSSTETQSRDRPVPPGNLLLNSAPPKASQVLLVQVPGPRKTGPLSQLSPRIPNPTSRQRMVLQPIQSTSGVQYYLKPDGKVVQLIPLSQLRPVNPSPPVQAGPSSSSSSSVTSASPLQTPTVTVFRSKPLTSSSSPLSAKKTTLKFLTSQSSRDTFIITSGKGPSPLPSEGVLAPETLPQPHAPSPPAAPINFISFKPAGGQGTEPEMKTVSKSAALHGPEGEPGPPQTPPPVETPLTYAPSLTETTIPRETPTSTGTTFTTGLPPPSTLPPPPTKTTSSTPPPTASCLSGPPADSPIADHKLARHPVDLEIICMDNGAGPVGTEMQPVEVVELTSSETENSSDSNDDHQSLQKRNVRPESVLSGFSRSLRRSQLR